MIFRAIFWIAVVAILMPREPDLGLGRPGADASTAGALFSRIAQLIEPQQSACGGHEMACAAASGAAATFKATAFQSLSQVKAEIEQAKRERMASR